jgi:hypothetical protein
MSVAMSLNTKVTRVYVRLLGEGTVVFRPVPAVPLGPGTVKLLAPNDYDPEDEDWEFKPGAIVQIESRTLEGEPAYLAVALLPRYKELVMSDSRVRPTHPSPLGMGVQRETLYLPYSI